MAKVVVLGEEVHVRPFALAGAQIRAAEEPAAVRAAWASLKDDVAVVILTPAAEAALGERERGMHDGVVTVTLP